MIVICLPMLYPMLYSIISYQCATECNYMFDCTVEHPHDRLQCIFMYSSFLVHMWC